MDHEYVMRIEYEEHSKRMEDEHRRMNHRILEVEKVIAENHKLLVSVEKLAVNMEALQKEQKEQGEKLAELESRDGVKWRNAAGYVVTALISAFLGFIFKQIGM